MFAVSRRWSMIDKIFEVRLGSTRNFAIFCLFFWVFKRRRRRERDRFQGVGRVATCGSTPKSTVNSRR